MGSKSHCRVWVAGTVPNTPEEQMIHRVHVVVQVELIKTVRAEGETRE